MNLTLIKAVIKARKKGLLHLAAADEPTRIDCLKNKCALCCKTLGAPVLTDEEAARIPNELIVRT